MKNKGGNPYPAMWLQEPFSPRQQAGGMYPTLIKQRMLAFPCPAREKAATGRSCLLWNFAWQLQSPQKLCKAALTPSALGTSLLLSSSSTWSCICFEQVLVQKPLSVPQLVFQLIPPGAKGPHSPSAALTSPGSDNPPKGDGLDFKAFKSQSAGLNLPNSVPAGIKPSWVKLGS